MLQQYKTAFATRFYPSRQHKERTRNIIQYILNNIGYLRVGRTRSWNENKDGYLSRASCCKEHLDTISIQFFDARELIGVYHEPGISV